jgi:hypothetical protein
MLLHFPLQSKSNPMGRRSRRSFPDTYELLEMFLDSPKIQ